MDSDRDSVFAALRAGARLPAEEADGDDVQRALHAVAREKQSSAQESPNE